jgi:epoxide hydrolase-like predicted phosphatase
MARDHSERNTNLAIRAVVFDIGGILEIVPGGGDPTKNFPEMIIRWEECLHMQPGELRAKIRGINEQLLSLGKDMGLGTCSEEEWQEELGHATGMSQDQVDAFMRDYWDVYLGTPNEELMAFFSGLRPRYQTALLSNSGSGARREEQERYHLNEMTDFIIYSHEEGVAKPDRRIFELTCARLGVQPEEIVFLDDAEPNVAAATAYGMHAILFTDTAQAIADVRSCLQEHAA